MGTYIAIDLKSFYASVECVLRGLDPLKTNLVVADRERTEKTICLAVSPSLKSYGIAGRCRLFEVIQRVKEVNRERQKKAKNRRFTGKTSHNPDLLANPDLELDFICATPQMATYLKYSQMIYQIYLEYISAEDIHVYSIDELFIDASKYLNTYKLTPEGLARKLVLEVYKRTGITATAGIGENMYLAKVAMDIVAKHIEPDEFGVRVAFLSVMDYRRKLWTHEPLTDFWRFGKGIVRRLNNLGLYNMGDIARCSLGSFKDYHNEDLLYKEFGINAELIIDHAWGYENCQISDIKAYQPKSKSLSQGQVLHCAYEYDQALLVVKEMTDLLVLDLVSKKLLTSVISIYIGYDIEQDTTIDDVEVDFYGRVIPKSTGGTVKLSKPTSSTRVIMSNMVKLFNRLVNRELMVRRISISFGELIDEEMNKKDELIFDLFTDYDKANNEAIEEKKALEKEKKAQEAIISIRKKYGKNACLKGMNLSTGATTIDRNKQIGGHKA